MARQARRGLGDDDIATLRQALADGGKPTVWFTDAAVGVKPGSSAKVLELTEPAAGEFIRVKPAGSTDELSFGATELTTTRPSRARTTPTATPARTAVPTPAERTGRASSPAPATPAPPATPRKPATPAKPDTPRKPATPSSAGTGSGGRGAAAQRQAPTTTVTVTSQQDGEWTVDVHTGKKRTVRALSVPASSVLAAARSLGDDVATAIDAAISAARERQEAEVRRLRDQLAAAERALDDLSG